VVRPETRVFLWML